MNWDPFDKDSILLYKERITIFHRPKVQMKNLIYTILLLITISGEMIHLAYLLSCQCESIELAIDIKGENESEENRDIGEDASEIPSPQISLDYFSNMLTFLSNNVLLHGDDSYDRISTPPPDFA